MIRFLKYFFSFAILVLFVGGYFLFTDAGKQYLYPKLSDIVTERTDIKIDVVSISTEKFPYLTAHLVVNDTIKVTLNGDLHWRNVDVNYTLVSHCISSSVCTVEDDVFIEGHATGDLTKIHFKGQGKALTGDVSFEGVKFIDRVEDFRLTLHQVSSIKLFMLLGQDTLIDGKADAEAVFTLMDEAHKQGSFTYDVKDNNFSDMPLALHTEVQIDDMQHTFDMDINAPSLKIKVKNGTYNQDTKHVKASYTLDIYELEALEALLGYKYLGSFSSKGEVLYQDTLSITGYSSSFGGVLDYIFKNGGLTVGLHDVSFMAFMSLFPYQPILEADTRGNIYYNAQRKTVIFNATLNETTFVRSNFSKNIYKKSRIKLHKEIFGASKFDAAYYNGTFTADIKLKNKKNHAYLSGAIINTRNNTINTYFDLKMQKKAYTGKVYGNYDDPMVDLDTKEAISYQVKRKLDAIVGKSNRKRIERLVNVFPMGSTVKDMVSEATSSFVDMLF
jgi:hypothetical protein